MNHKATVEIYIFWSIRHHLSGEPVFHAKAILCVRNVGVKMAVLLIKLFVVIVRHLQDALLDTEGVGKVFAERMPRDFYCPARKIFSVEK